MKTWHRSVKPARKYPIISEGLNTHVARVVANSGEDDAAIEARCNLIAAAPELLELARAFIVLWPLIPGRDVPKATPEVVALWRRAVAFVAKAEGRE